MKDWVITAWSPSLQRRINELRLVEQDRKIRSERVARMTAESFADRLNRQQFQHAQDWQPEYQYLELGQQTLVERQNSQ